MMLPVCHVRDVKVRVCGSFAFSSFSSFRFLSSVSFSCVSSRSKARKRRFYSSTFIRVSSISFFSGCATEYALKDFLELSINKIITTKCNASSLPLLLRSQEHAFELTGEFFFVEVGVGVKESV